MVAVNIDNIPIDISLDDDEAIDKHIDYSDLENKLKAKLNFEFETIIAVDGAPIVGFDKKDRLIGVVRKLFAKEEIEIKEDGIFMPFEEDANGHNMSQGFLFVDCLTPQDAEKAIKHIHLHKFDKFHTFQLNKFLDIEKYSHVPEKWNESKVIGVGQELTDRGFLREWLLDPAARDQFAMLNQNTTSILWNNKKSPPDVVCSRPHWTDMYFTFSPRGSFFATLHQQGVAIFGGEKMNRIHRFHHPSVSHIDFSPYETYLVTYSSVPLPRPTADKSWGIESIGHHFMIWNIETGQLMRSFPLPPDSNKTVPWPYFKWSWDEQFFATIVNNQKLSIFEASTFSLFEKKSIPIPGITEFEWMPYSKQEKFHIDLSPTPIKKKKPAKQTTSEKANVVPPHCVAYFVPDRGSDLPSQLVLYDVRKKEKLRQKQVFYARSAKIHFHPSGDYLLFKLDRCKVLGKAVWNALEVFRLNEKGFLCDTLEMKGTLLALAWEPVGDSLVLLSTLSPVGPQHPPMDSVLIHFYTMKNPLSKTSPHDALPTGMHLVKIIERPKVILNSLFWSPKGRFIVVAGLSLSNSVLEYYDTQAIPPSQTKMVITTDVNGQTVTTESEVTPIKFLGKCNSTLGNYVHWDPSGRYVLIASTVVAKNQDTHYMLTDLHGKILYKQSVDLLRQIQWRPRPPPILPVEKLRQIASKLKTYSKEFDAMDASATAEVSAQEIQRRNKLFEEWAVFISKSLLQIPALKEVKTYH